MILIILTLYFCKKSEEASCKYNVMSADEKILLSISFSDYKQYSETEYYHKGYIIKKWKNPATESAIGFYYSIAEVAQFQNRCPLAVFFTYKLSTSFPREEFFGLLNAFRITEKEKSGITEFFLDGKKDKQNIKVESISDSYTAERSVIQTGNDSFGIILFSERTFYTRKILNQF